MNRGAMLTSNGAEQDGDGRVARVAAAIGEPRRARILYSLLDGRARTATELATAAEVSASTATVHLRKLTAAHLLNVAPQGKHRYYSLAGPNVARAMESLSILAGNGARRKELAENATSPLRIARTCYDHIAGMLGVALHDRMHEAEWIAPRAIGPRSVYEITRKGKAALAALGIDMEAVARARRRFAFPCLDWSERRPHLAGALAATLLRLALKRKWVVQDLDSRALELTPRGRREMHANFGIRV